MKAEDYLQTGDLENALAALTEQVRKNPAKVELRIFLFQLLSVLGQWDRAMTQLNVAAEMDSDATLMAMVYRDQIARLNRFLQQLFCLHAISQLIKFAVLGGNLAKQFESSIS